MSRPAVLFPSLKSTSSVANLGMQLSPFDPCKIARQFDHRSMIALRNLIICAFRTKQIEGDKLAGLFQLDRNHTTPEDWPPWRTPASGSWAVADFMRWKVSKTARKACWTLLSVRRRMRSFWGRWRIRKLCFSLAMDADIVTAPAR